MPGRAEGLFDVIRRSCRQELDRTEGVRVNINVLEQYAASLSVEEVKEAANTNHTRLPLQFEDHSSEVNLLSVMHLLCFGSGYEAELQEHCRTNWQECMQFGALAMYISGSKLDAEFMMDFNDLKVNNYFRIPTHEEVPSEMHPAIRVSRPGPLMPLVKAIRQQMNQTGAAVAGAGFSSLGELVVFILEDARTVETAVYQLGEAVQGFKDWDSGTGVAFYSKAQALVDTLCQRFAADDPSRFVFPDVGSMTASADSLLLSTLVELGIVEVHRQILDETHELDAHGSAAWSNALRASAVVAVDLLAAALDGNVTARQMDAYLRSRPHLATQVHPSVPLHLVNETVFY